MVTVAFTDLEGFTSFTDAHGDGAAAALLSEHYRAAGHVVRRWRGTLADLEREGALRPGVVPDIAAAQVVAAMDGLQVQWLLDPDGVDMAAALGALVNALVVEPL